MKPSNFATLLAAALVLFTNALLASTSAVQGDGFRKLAEIVPVNSAPFLDDTFLNHTDKDAVKVHFTRIFSDLELARSDSARLFLRAISKNNLAAFEVMMELNLDPFMKDAELKMSARAILLSLDKLTVQQAQMKALIQTGQNALPINARVTEVKSFYHDKLLKFIARTGTLSDLEAYRATSLPIARIPVRIYDGSTLYHQAVIGNNIDLLRSFSTDEHLKQFINTTWILNEPNEDIDLSNFSGLNPVGWTPLMLAVAMNRLEIIQYLVSLSSILMCPRTADGVDARVLARSLPANIRFPMLRLLRKGNPNFKTPECDAFGTMKKAIEGGAKSACLNYYSWQYPEHDKETIEAAVAHLDIANLKIILDEAAIVHDNSLIFRHFWNGLKQDIKSSSMVLQSKIILLAQYGFRFDIRYHFVDYKTPWYEILTQTTGIRPELIDAMLKSSTINLNMNNAA